MRQKITEFYKQTCKELYQHLPIPTTSPLDHEIADEILDHPPDSQSHGTFWHPVE
jgi:hypothetical protein